MKNQYFGDINDFRKYGLLRVLSKQGTKQIAICWMLTPNDGRSDGNNISYLNIPNKWRHFDIELFDFLVSSLTKNPTRNVSTIEKGNIVPTSTYYTRFLTDIKYEREQYFSEFLSQHSFADLIFYDPDNGLEVKSKRKGLKYSCKFLYWDEVRDTISRGHSILIYQHYPRINRNKYHHIMLEKLRTILDWENIFIIGSSNVVYFLLSQDKHFEYFQERMLELSNKWNPTFKVIRPKIRIFNKLF